jgi:hypothetical protein
VTGYIRPTRRALLGFPGRLHIFEKLKRDHIRAAATYFQVSTTVCYLQGAVGKSQMIAE